MRSDCTTLRMFLPSARMRASMGSVIAAGSSSLSVLIWRVIIIQRLLRRVEIFEGRRDDLDQLIGHAAARAQRESLLLAGV
jgi:hypothetical protein